MERLGDILNGGYQRTREIARADSKEGIDVVARQFEAYFLHHLVKGMRQAGFGDPNFSSSQSEFYQDLFDQQITLALAGGRGIGLAKVLSGQLAGAIPAPNNEANAAAMGEHGPQRTLPDPMASRPATGWHPNARGIPSGGFLAPSQDDSPTVPTKEAEVPSTAPAPAPAAVAPGVRRQSPSIAFASPKEFVETLRPHAERAAAAIGVSAEVLLAQSALETGWGKHIMSGAPGAGSSHNMFGIKADRSWQGAKVVRKTLEFEQGVMKKVDAYFRSYNSYAESFDDYVKFLKENPRYRAALNETANPEKFVKALQKAGYATDPLYAQKILALTRGEQLRLAGD